MFNFWFHTYFYDPQLVAKYVRVVMQGANSSMNRYGIYRYGFYGRTETVMILSRNRVKQNCFAKSENTYFMQDQPIMSLYCLDAIMQVDVREIFVIEGKKIQVYMDELCLAPDNDSDTNSLIVISLHN